MQPVYEHRQFGAVILALVLFPTLCFGAAIALSEEPAALLPLTLILLFMFFTAFIFSSLMVRVDAKTVQLFFGPGFFRRSIPLETIRAVRVVRNAPWMGLGIHFIRGGMIYNVSGLDGIEIELQNDRRVRIGSDEPAALASAIEEARSAHAAGR